MVYSKWFMYGIFRGLLSGLLNGILGLGTIAHMSQGQTSIVKGTIDAGHRGRFGSLVECLVYSLMGTHVH